MLMFFTEQVKSDLEIRKKALSGLGFLCTRHHDLLRGNRLSRFFRDLLQADTQQQSGEEGEESHRPKSPDHALELKCVVLENLLNFFLEEEKSMLEANERCKLLRSVSSLELNSSLLVVLDWWLHRTIYVGSNLNFACHTHSRLPLGKVLS